MEQETTHYLPPNVNLWERKRNTKDMANVFRNRPQSDQLTRYSAPSVPLELLWSTSTTTSMRIDRTGPQENLPLGFYANVPSASFLFLQLSRVSVSLLIKVILYAYFSIHFSQFYDSIFITSDVWRINFIREEMAKKKNTLSNFHLLLAPIHLIGLYLPLLLLLQVKANSSNNQ